MVTLTPPRFIESGIESAAAALEARFVPKTEISDPGVTPLGARPKLAPLTTPPGATTGGWHQAAGTSTVTAANNAKDSLKKCSDFILGDGRVWIKDAVKEFTEVRKVIA